MIKRLPNKLNNRFESGFTLIELIVVIAIIATMSAFVVLRFSGPRDEAQNAQRRSDIRQYQTAIEVYANGNNSLYPTPTGALTGLCGTLGLGACPDDPLPAEYISYQYSVNAGQTSYVLWAELAKSDTFFVSCSNGAVGEVANTTAIADGVCPI